MSSCVCACKGASKAPKQNTKHVSKTCLNKIESTHVMSKEKHVLYAGRQAAGRQKGIVREGGKGGQAGVKRWEGGRW